jgi:hypothetical protein
MHPSLIDTLFTNMEEIIYRSSVGVSGFIASIWLQGVDQVISLFVGLATLTFMVLSIIKIVRELKNGR